MQINNLNLLKSTTMKNVTKLFAVVLLTVVSFSLTAQNPMVIVEYMKVTQGSESAYLEVEQAWKKVHQKRIDAGISAGWQLWRNVYAGYNDPYQYMTVNWYTDLAQSFKPTPDGFWDEFQDLLNKTGETRVLATRQVSYQIAQAENSMPSNYIYVNQMHVKQGMGGDYVDMELEVFKPVHEEAIKRGLRSHWGIWSNWPLKEGGAAYVTVDGYKDVAQLTGGGDMNDDLFSAVHPGKSADEVYDKINKLRKMDGTELWELVDQVMPAQ